MVKAIENVNNWEHRKVAYLTCRVKFKRQVNLDYVEKLETDTDWKVAVLGEDCLLLCSNNSEETVDSLIRLSRQHGNCCRYIQLSRR